MKVNNRRKRKMQTLVEKMYEQKTGADGLYKIVSPDEIRIPARFPGAGIEIPMELPGVEIPTEVPLEVRLGCQVPQGMYVMYSFGIMDSQLFQGGYDLPGCGLQLHLHGPDRTTITQATIMDYDRNVIRELNGYEASMAAYNADSMGFKRFFP